MFEVGSCTLVSEAVLKQSALSPRRFAFATHLPGKTAPRARERRRRESSPLPMRSYKQIRYQRGQRSVRSRRKRRRAVTWSSTSPRHVGLGEVFAVRVSDHCPAIQVPISDHRRCGILQRTVWLAAGADLFPHLPAMDRNGRIDLEAESHAAAPEFEYRDLEQALEAASPSDHNGFQSFSRKHQHGRTSVLMTILQSHCHSRCSRVCHWRARTPARRY